MPQAKNYVSELERDFLISVEKMRGLLNDKYGDAIGALYATMLREAAERGFDLAYWRELVKAWMQSHCEYEKDCTCGERIYFFWTRTTINERGKVKPKKRAPYDLNCLSHYARCPHGSRHRKGDRAGQGTYVNEKVSRGRKNGNYVDRQDVESLDGVPEGECGMQELLHVPRAKSVRQRPEPGAAIQDHLL